MLHFICPLYGHTTFLCYNSLYEWRNGNGKYTILTTGHYILLITLLITLYTLASNFIVATNKFLQIMLFSTHLFHYYKFSINVCAAQVSLSTQHSQKLFRIALAMGGAVGLAHFNYIPALFNPEYLDIAIAGGAILFFIQQAVIMTFFMFTKKMLALCKSYFSSD